MTPAAQPSSAVAWNRIAGRRAVCGNYNEPCNIGVFLNDLPAQNRLTVLDKKGEIVADASVNVYQATGNPESEWFYTKVFDDEPDLVLWTDADGAVLLGRNPFSEGLVRHTWEISNTIAVIRVEDESRIGYGFLEISGFNMAFWRGEIEHAEHEIRINMLSKGN